MLKKISAYLVLMLYCYTVDAKPYIPSDMNQVLEQLPNNPDLSSTNYKSLRTQLLASPNNVNLAVKLARLYIERSRDEGDPRYLGYAQSALTPWWHIDKPPIEGRGIDGNARGSRRRADRRRRDRSPAAARAGSCPWNDHDRER